MYVSEPDVENGGTGLVDYGYEVLDHELLDETYGTLAEFDALLKEAHDLGKLDRRKFVIKCS